MSLGKAMSMDRAAGLLAAACLAMLVLATRASHVAAQADKPTPQDRAAVAACLDLVKQNQAAAAKKPDFPPAEQPGAGERLKAAAADAASASESCIGAVANPCTAEPGGQSTLGMVQCSGRELAVWDELLNKAYRDALAAAEPKLREALRKAQRAWIADRDARCALPAIENEGGSIVGPLTIACLVDVTAHQALWLEGED